jgi:hypothetical protein
MKAKEVDFQFSYGGRKMNATLQITHPFKHKMYRVYVPKAGSNNGEVFIFHEVNEQGQRFFYHPTNSFKDEMARSILKQLSLIE